MSDFNRTEGDGEEPLRFALQIRTSPITVQAKDLTAEVVKLYVRAIGAVANLTEFDGTDISSGIVGSPTDGNVDWPLTTAQIAQLVAGDYEGQVVTEGAGPRSTSFPNDPITGREVFTLHVARSLAS